MKRVLASFVVLSALFAGLPAHAQLQPPTVNIVGCSAVPMCYSSVQRSIYAPGDVALKGYDDQGQGITILNMPVGGNLQIRNLDADTNPGGNFCQTAADKVACHTLTSDALVTKGGATCTRFVFDECEYLFTSDAPNSHTDNNIDPLDVAKLDFFAKLNKGTYTFHCLLHAGMKGVLHVTS